MRDVTAGDDAHFTKGSQRTESLDQSFFQIIPHFLRESPEKWYPSRSLDLFGFGTGHANSRPASCKARSASKHQAAAARKQQQEEETC
jgi:hypothetical protein